MLAGRWPSWPTSRVSAEHTFRTVAYTSRTDRQLGAIPRYGKANNQRAEDKAAELKQLNRSIFRPSLCGTRRVALFYESGPG